MNKLEHQEMGELIEEISAKGFPGFETDVNDTGPVRMVGVQLYQHRIDAVTPQTSLDGARFWGESLVDVFRQAVNAIRRMRGEPTLEEEVSKMIAEEEAHAQTLIQCEAGAACSCGSRFLMVEKVLKMAVDLHDGTLAFTEPPPITFAVDDGEIARCPSCRKWYQLRA